MGVFIAYVLLTAFYSGAVWAIEKKYERKLDKAKDEMRMEFEEKIRELKADKGISYDETKIG